MSSAWEIAEFAMRVNDRLNYRVYVTPDGWLVMLGHYVGDQYKCDFLCTPEGKEIAYESSGLAITAAEQHMRAQSGEQLEAQREVAQ
jgi:hypothetical protein